MTEYAKLAKIGFSRLSNREFHTLMSDMFIRMPKAKDGGISAIGVSKELMERFGAELQRMSRAMSYSRSAPQTALLKEVDKQRDEILTGLIARIMLSQHSPIEAERKAAQVLALMAQNFRGAAYIPVSDESGAINSLSELLRSEKYAPHVATLGLLPYLEELEKIERKYAGLLKEREKYWVQYKHLGSATAARQRLQEMYEEITAKAMAYNVIATTPETESFIHSLNILINRTKLSFKRRKKRQWTKKNGTDKAD